MIDRQYQSRSFNAFARYNDIGSDFRADLGFMPRVDFRSISQDLL